MSAEYVVMCCLLASAVFRTADFVYHYSDVSQNIPKDTKLSMREYRLLFKHLKYKKWDNLFALFAFLWVYLEILATGIIFHFSHYFLVKILSIFYVTGCFRALQEIGHFAVHGTLCPNKKWGYLLTNLFYQFPTFMPAAVVRNKIHVIDHHNSVNMKHDPDLEELRNAGLKPKITEWSFWVCVFYPVTVNGILSRSIDMYNNLITDWINKKDFFIRVSIVLVIIMLLSYFELYSELFVLYLLPIFITYPLFYWLAHLSLHRWYANCPENIPYIERELILGKPTEFRGYLGFIIRHTIFPIGDSYHLAHSLFPYVRWNYLKQIDTLLKANAQYIENETDGLFISAKSGKTSAILDLKNRLVISNDHVM